MSETAAPRQIVAMGGGGFSMDDPLLDDFVFRLTGKAKPRVCFLATASGDAALYFTRYHRAMTPDRAEATHLSLFERDERDLRDHLLSQDVIYIGGGNTANMLAVWRVHGVDRILREAWEQGIILTGLSAGMICWYEASVTDSFGPLAPLPDGLGLITGSACPHYDGEAQRRPTFHRCVRERLLPPGVAADDYAALHYVDGQLHQAVSSKPKARAYRVELNGERVVETQIDTHYLG